MQQLSMNSELRARRRVMQQLIEALLFEGVIVPQEGFASSQLIYDREHAVGKAVPSLEIPSDAARQPHSSVVVLSDAVRQPHSSAEVISDAVKQSYSSTAVISDAVKQSAASVQQLVFTGRDEAKRLVTYACSARRRFTFGWLELLAEPIMRTVQGQSDSTTEEACDPQQFLREVVAHALSSYSIQPSFYQEIAATLQNEQLRLEETRTGSALVHLSLAEVEALASQGHPYHPCFRSRIGFDLEDQRSYAPEFAPSFAVMWVAAHQEKAGTWGQDGKAWEHVLEMQLTASELHRLQVRLLEHGAEPATYRLLPVHPWQWERCLQHAYAEDIEQHWLIPLGLGEQSYKPQQSIRTLSNVSTPAGSALKLPLHIVNTSSLRELTPHSVAAAPEVSSWLQRVVATDDYFWKEARVVLLQEFASASYLPANGALSAIWREPIEAYLQEGEQAYPFHALLTVQELGAAREKRAFAAMTAGAEACCGQEMERAASVSVQENEAGRMGEQQSERLAIQPWLTQYGLERWFRELIRKGVMPVVHLLAAHGIVLESHAQNMILIHREGWPVGVALRDFHEGVEFTASYIASPELVPDFAQLHPAYRSGSVGDYFEMPDVQSLQEMMIDALWFMNIGFLIMRLADDAEAEGQQREALEQKLWQIIRLELAEYERLHPKLRERLAELKLFVPYCSIEPLAQQRMTGTVAAKPQQAPNPLHWCMETKNM
ncbi:IucA/IucC family protein [Paenibacillus aquistagni]|uniref:IucA/IucC family protein n=1 Tax=Paenibacillus aquistagni TaxID=1852522 RepID=UPI00145A7572|nr:IucA/IucC family protein [Paenibacillus aquistagni]NMM51601.1 hypothetical protein [Paenibacillus aquistagni]